MIRVLSRLALLPWICAGLLCAQSESALDQADAAFRNGDLDRAAALARQVLASDPDAVQAHMILGVIAAQNHEWETSDGHFEAVVRLSPASPYGYFYLGQSKLYQRQWEPAIQYFNKAQQRHYPDHDRLIVEMAFAQNEAGRPKAALESLANIRPPADGPLGAQYHAVTAFAKSRLGEPAPAIEAVRRALDLDDTNPQYWEFLISTLIRTDQTPQALAEAIRAQKRFPDNPDVQFLFALSSYYVTESPLTGLALRNLREAEPVSPRVLLVQGLFDRKQGHNEQALSAFRKAAEQGVPDAPLLLGILLKENGDYAGAEREYREAERLDPNNGQVMLELGKLLLTRGNLQEALTRLEKAEQRMPNVAAVHYQLGLVYRRLGRNDEAKQQLSRYRNLEQRQTQLLQQP